MRRCAMRRRNVRRGTPREGRGEGGDSVGVMSPGHDYDGLYVALQLGDREGDAEEVTLGVVEHRTGREGTC